MRYLVVLLLVSGCAADLHADQYEGACARQCLAVNSDCISRQPAGFRGACDDNARQCLSTCPAK
jgi:hypothetical protein